MADMTSPINDDQEQPAEFADPDLIQRQQAKIGELNVVDNSNITLVNSRNNEEDERVAQAANALE